MAKAAPDTLRLISTAGTDYDRPNRALPDELTVFVDGVDVMSDQGPVGDAVETADGGAIVYFGPAPIDEDEGSDHNRNLAEILPESELSAISIDLLEGIDSDEQSRQQWLQTRAAGMKLLALTVEQPASSNDGAPIEGMSTVRHPMLLEATIRFQSNARAELLPTDGPVKIRNDDPKVSLDDNPRAEALAKDMNHYLTTTATEYYPDTDRMLFKLGFGGSEFKKAYHCPIRNRPVIETVSAEDLIVSDTATDMRNAPRVTHRIKDMKRSTMKRMQLVGAYRDVPLTEPTQQTQNTVDLAVARMAGTDINRRRPQDVPYEVYECYCELDLPGFEHKVKGKPSGLPLPYCVTIEKTSRQILAVRRNWKEGDETYQAREVFVHYMFVPGFGFYGYGFLHMLGNITQAVTAAMRMFLDAGMFANFPGFLIAKAATRQQTNVFRIPPGGAQVIDTGSMALSDAVMPLPYKEPGPASIELMKYIAETGQRVGGTAEIAVGEGRQDAPVGTTLALIDQATKPLAAVHKRMFSAQARELQLLKALFQEDPEAFWRNNPKGRWKWTADELIEALNDSDLVPQADPNTASHLDRLMKAVAIEQLAEAHPDLYDERAVQTMILGMINIGDPDQLFKSEEDAAAPDPETMKVEAELALKSRELDIKEADQKLKGGLAAADMQGRQMDLQAKGAETQAKVALAGLKVQSESGRGEVDKQKLGLAAAAFEHERQEADRVHERGLIDLQLENERTKEASRLAEASEAHEDRRHAADIAAKVLTNQQDNKTALDITREELVVEERNAKLQAKSKIADRGMKNGNGINPKKRK